MAAAVGFAAAGFWQLGRLEDRRELNAQIELARAAESAPLGFDALPLPEFTTVTAAGTWASDAEVALPLQTFNGAAGVHLLTPLVTESGTALVDRGWVPLDEVDSYPAASGDVRITATVRSAESGRATGGTEGGRPSVSRRDPSLVADLGDIPIADVVLDLVSEEPPSQPAPLPPLPASLGEGNHLLYAIQWFSFIGIVIIGFGALLRRQLPSMV